MLDNLAAQFASSGFMPHGHCILWQPPLLLTYILSDGLIALSYFTIPVALWVLVSKRKDIRFGWLFLLFATFIFLCGTTHIFGIVTMWKPMYWADALTKTTTGIVSAFTAIMTWRSIPLLLRIPSPAQLDAANHQLREEIRQRAATEEGLRASEARYVALLASLEQRIAERTADLERLASELLVSRHAAEEANRAKGAFLATMSHEIRTPLNAVLGITQLLLDGEASPRQRNYLQKTKRSAADLLRILGDILDYSKVEAGKIEFEQLPFDLEAPLLDAANACAERIERNGLDVVVRIDPRLPPRVIGDPLRLGQVLGNLLGNAVKFTPRGSVLVAVSLVGREDEAASIRFEVRDTGIGIPADRLAQLFEPFTQADSSITRRYGGTGLGLSISHRLVAMMGGELRARSVEGEGSSFEFTVRLPVAADGEPRAPENTLAGRRVLLLEDCALAREALLEQLQGMGADVTAVGSGEEAATLLGQVPAHDLLLLDWSVPGIDGLALARRARSLPGGAFVPIVMMANAMVREQLVAEAFALGLGAVLDKPVLPSELRAALAQALLQDSASPAAGDAHTRSAHRLLARMAGASVLLVEDNALNQEVTAEVLTNAGLQVRLAANGYEALDCIGQQRFDAVLMDVQMPQMDGLEATRRIRALPAGQGLPIIAMTAAALGADRIASRAAGMNAHLVKPIDNELLARTLLEWIPWRAVSAAGIAAQEPDSRAASPATPQDDTPEFEVSAALARLDGRRDLLLRLLRQFLATHARTAAQLRQARDAGDAQEIHRIAHRLRGEAGNLGLAEVARAASALLDGNRGQSMPDAHVVESLASGCDHALALLANRVGAENAGIRAATDDSPPQDAAELRVQLEQLRRLLADGVLAARDAVETLTGAMHRIGAGELFGAVAEAVQRLDFDAAQLALTRLQEQMDRDT